MNTGFLNTVQPAPPPMALCDLFAVPRLAAAATPRIAAQQALPPAQAAGRAPLPWAAVENACAAAWLLLQARWTGAGAQLHEPGQLAGADRGRRLSAVVASCDSEPARDVPARDWLASVAGQRERHPVATDSDAATAPFAPFALWLREALTLDAAPATLRLRLERSDGTDLLHADADAAALQPEALHAVLAALAHAASELLTRPSAPLGEIATQSAADRVDQLLNWNRPLDAIDLSQTVPARFRRQAQATPDAPAVVQGDQSLSYAALAARADVLAAALLQAGVVPGERVALLMDRSLDAVVAHSAVLQVGAAYVPLPTDWPAARIAAALAQAQVRHALAEPAHRHLLGADVTVVDPRVDAAADVADTQGALPPACASAIDGESAAYVMYTSGTTGRPKAIEISHRAILRLVLQARFADFGPGRAMLHAAPLGFDAATLEIWGPLLNGGCCVVHGERVPSPAGLASTLGQHAPDTAWLTAALFNAVIDDDPGALTGLRHLLVGGEALSVAHLRRAQAHLPTLALTNGYGPTECTTFATTWRIPDALPADTATVPLGFPIQQTVLRVLSPTQALLPSGLVGELCIGGHGLARGYVGDAALSAAAFVPDPCGAPGERLYRTGDLARWRADGSIEFLGRRDGQLKLHGHRVELGEIEAALMQHPAVQACAVQPWPDASGELRLAAYLVPAGERCDWTSLREHLAARLPTAWIPAAQVWLERLPVTANGKLDRRALPPPDASRPELAQPYEAARNAPEQQVCAAFARVLQLERVGRHDNFFELGGDSLRVLQVLALLHKQTPADADARALSPTLFFRQPTPAAIATHLSAAQSAAHASAAPAPAAAPAAAPIDAPIAIIGMAGRFPGADDVEQFWDNLLAGRDSIRSFDDATLDPGVPQALRRDPAYVRARGVIEGIEDFDAAFFGFTPREAALMDPQHRVFLEICWECLERAGHVPGTAGGPVGVFAGMYNASYARRHLDTRPDLVEAAGAFQTMLANEKDYIATRVAHRLDLTGPAISVHTACSTSLVAVAQAMQALRSGQCRMALAGGASVTCPPRSGHLYVEGGMLSPDGHTRSFDARAQGTVFSDGAAVVLLKRLADAQADGDTVYAVLRSACVNNDGGAKASFTAPSVEGQAAVIRAALADAGVNARSISYVEAHGTATPMGDPVEVEALRTAYAEHTAELQFCTLGALKSNVGHLVTAAGAAGLIKTALALHHECLPPTVHFTAPNPAIDFARTPFRIQSTLQAWPRGAVPRRAGVSAFGVGGTNAHAIVEEAPLPGTAAPALAGAQLLALSARSQPALAAAAQRLAAHLDAHPQQPLADVAHTLAVGRRAFAVRLAVVATDASAAAAALRQSGQSDASRRVAGQAGAQPPELVFAFPGQGAQYAGMGRTLHAQDPVFAAALDDVLQAFGDAPGLDLRAALFADDPGVLAPTAVTQPALFAIEYALARRLMAAGAAPQALLGHSVGEFVAAVLADVMDLADAARLVASRGALMQAQPPGAMLAVRLSADALRPRLGDTLALAAENGPAACVAAGPAADIARLQSDLQREDVGCRMLAARHAFHSAMMDAAVAPLQALLANMALRAPRIPLFSTVTGRLLTDAQATSPAHWAQQMRATVRFSPAVRSAQAALAHPLFVEVGPQTTLSALVRQHGARALPLLPHATDSGTQDEPAALRLALAGLWTEGEPVDLARLAGRPGGRRVRLPTYPFQRQRCWVDVAPTATSPRELSSVPTPLPLSEPTVNPATPSPATAPESPPARDAALVQQIRLLVEDITGIDLQAADGQAPFTELGLDSLSLTQVATQVQKQMGVRLAFRQLMEELRSIDLLADYVQAQRPASASPATPLNAVATGVAMPATLPAAMPVAPQPVIAGGNESALQQLIAQQMALMQSQLALLGSASLAPAAVSEAAPVPAQPMPVAAVAAAQAPTEAPSAAEPLRYDVSKAFGAIARIHTKTGGSEPSQRQKVRLAAFTRRYLERTARSKAFAQDNRAHMADPRVVSGFRPLTKEIVYPIVIEHSEGAHLRDIDGNDYVDALNGFGVSLFGWRPEFVQEAVRRQLDVGYEIGPQHPLAAEVTRLLCELTGCERAGLCNTGSEAVMAALRIARTVTGRSTVVMFAGAYHGTFDEVLVRAGKAGRGLPAAPGVMAGMFGDVRVLEYGTPEALDFIRAHAHELAAVLVEPVQSRRPELQPREFLQALRSVTAEQGCCLIFDEVITGFRVGLGGAQALFGVQADLATYGKVIGGGFPIGVIAGRRAFMDALDGGAWQYGDDSMPTVGVTYFAGTFVRHPLALAATQAVLQHLKASGPALQEGLNARTADMAQGLSAWCAQVGAPIVVRQFSSLWRVAWLEEHPLQELLFPMMRSRGVHILENFPCFLTSAHSAADIACIETAFRESVAELQESGLLPRRSVPDLSFEVRRSADADADAMPPMRNGHLGYEPKTSVNGNGAIQEAA